LARDGHVIVIRTDRGEYCSCDGKDAERRESANRDAALRASAAAEFDDLCQGLRRVDRTAGSQTVSQRLVERVVLIH
jgi:hypothetical protein